MPALGSRRDTGKLKRGISGNCVDLKRFQISIEAFLDIESRAPDIGNGLENQAECTIRNVHIGPFISLCNYFQYYLNGKDLSPSFDQIATNAISL